MEKYQEILSSIVGGSDDIENLFCGFENDEKLKFLKALYFVRQEKFDLAFKIISDIIEEKKESVNLYIVDLYRFLVGKISKTVNEDNIRLIEKFNKISFDFEGGSFSVPVVFWDNIAVKFGFDSEFNSKFESFPKLFKDWKMELDDSVILRYIYQNLKPKRHFEFGTWQGYGTSLVLEECSAGVWTINLPFGEKRENGDSAYGHNLDEESIKEIRNWASKIGFSEHNYNPEYIYQTDSVGFIGRYYLDKGYGNRVCQIYSSSLDFNEKIYPEGFFDSVLIDGGHDYESVRNDTKKALHLVKEGGVVMWHDFCPSVDFESSIGTVNYISKDRDFINENFSDLFWIYPSFVLVGIKGKNYKKFIVKSEERVDFFEVGVSGVIKRFDDFDKKKQNHLEYLYEDKEKQEQEQINLECSKKDKTKKKTRFFRNVRRIFVKIFAL